MLFLFANYPSFWIDQISTNLAFQFFIHTWLVNICSIAYFTPNWNWFFKMRFFMLTHLIKSIWCSFPLETALLTLVFHFNLSFDFPYTSTISETFILEKRFNNPHASLNMFYDVFSLIYTDLDLDFHA